MYIVCIDSLFVSVASNSCRVLERLMLVWLVVKRCVMKAYVSKNKHELGRKEEEMRRLEGLAGVCDFRNTAISAFVCGL